MHLYFHTKSTTLYNTIHNYTKTTQHYTNLFTTFYQIYQTQKLCTQLLKLRNNTQLLHIFTIRDKTSQNTTQLYTSLHNFTRLYTTKQSFTKLNKTLPFYKTIQNIQNLTKLYLTLQKPYESLSSLTTLYNILQHYTALYKFYKALQHYTIHYET